MELPYLCEILSLRWTRWSFRLRRSGGYHSSWTSCVAITFLKRYSFHEKLIYSNMWNLVRVRAIYSMEHRVHGFY